jgi:hypothetical protein
MRGFEEVLDDLGIDIAIESFFHHTVGRKRDVRPLEIVDSDGHVIVALEPLLNVDLEGVDTIRKGESRRWWTLLT